MAGLVSDDGAAEAARAVEEDPVSATSAQKRRITALAEKYRERPELLDHVLEDVVSPLGRSLQRQALSPDLRSLQTISVLLVSLANARGSKALEPFLPHDGRDLPSAVSLYELADASRGASKEDPDPDSSGTAWESRAALLDWLALLVLSPFSLASVDTETTGARCNCPPLGRRILVLGQVALSEPSAGRDRAARVLGRLLARPDTGDLMEKDFLPWALSCAADSDLFLAPGALRTLAFAFKSCRAERASALAPIAWASLEEQVSHTQRHHTSPLSRHMLIKAQQRIALGLLNGSDTGEVSEQIENAVERALDACRDRDTSVRWSGAKALSRIAVQLGADAAEDIASSALALLSNTESDSAWHGGCLAVAELSRRRCLPESLLDDATQKSALALLYERRQGAASLGEHVRDAGAFIVWAMARCCQGLDAELLEQRLAGPLVQAAVLDREVHCRRAAVAAFQECAGRVGMPDGMDIIALADYVSIGARYNAFISVAPQICEQNDLYASAILRHLVNDRTMHWDASLRELAALSLAECSGSLPVYAREEALPTLLQGCLSRELPVRHGSALAAAELVKGLARHNIILSSDEQKQVAETVPNVERARLYRGKGGEAMRGACCRLIRRLADAGVGIHSEQTRRKLAATVEECVAHPTQSIRTEAAAAAGALAAAGHLSSETVMPRYIASVESQLPAAQRGYAELLSHMPIHFISPFLEQAASVLSRALVPAMKADERDAETRAQAMQTIRAIVAKSPQNDNLASVSVHAAEAALQGAADHCIDSRGDVGSWVREPSLQLAAELAEKLASTSENAAGETSERFAMQALSYALKQSAERLDRLRASATQAARRLAKRCHADAIFALLPEDAKAWSDPATAFPEAEPLLGLQSELWRDVADGLTCSAGGPGDAVGKNARSALASRAKRGAKGGPHAARALSAALEPLRRRPRDGRDAPSALRALEQLFQASAVGEEGDNCDKDCKKLLDVAREALSRTRSELKGSSDVGKLCIGASVLAHLAAQPSLRSEALKALAPYLGHKYPKVRRAAADALYLRLLPLAEEEEEELESQDEDARGWAGFARAVEVLEQTEWDGDIGTARKSRDELCEAMGVSKPKAVQAVGRTSSNERTERGEKGDSLASYAALVDSAGY
jgi:hypothetical protein